MVQIYEYHCSGDDGRLANFSSNGARREVSRRRELRHEAWKEANEGDGGDGGRGGAVVSRQSLYLVERVIYE